MKISELFESEDSIQLPKLKVGDELLVGKFKNRKAIIKGFSKDKNNHPIAKTNKGPQALLKPRVPKLYDETVRKESVKESARLFSAIRLDEIPPKYKNLKVLGRGTTSIALEKDPKTVILLTRDRVKSEWLTQTWGLHLATYIDEYTSARQHHIRGVSDIPIQILEMPKLFPLSLENKRKAKELVTLVNKAKQFGVNYSNLSDPKSYDDTVLKYIEKHADDYEAAQIMKNMTATELYNELTSIDISTKDFYEPHQLRTLINFLRNYDSDQYTIDLGIRNFMQDAEGKLIILDPIADRKLIDLYRKNVTYF